MDPELEIQSIGQGKIDKFRGKVDSKIVVDDDDSDINTRKADGFITFILSWMSCPV